MRGLRGTASGRESGTLYKPAIRRSAEPLSGGAHPSLRVLRPDPPLPPSIIFPLRPPACGDQCRAERALGCGRILPRGQRAGATGEEAAEGRKCEGGAGNGFGSRVGYTIQTCDPSVSRTAVRWGPRFSSSAPPRSPAPSFDHFPFGHARAFITTMVTNYVNTKLFLHVDSILALTIPRNV